MKDRQQVAPRRSEEEATALALANKGLIDFVVCRIIKRGLDKSHYMDVYQSLWPCFYRAAQLWDENRGVKFSTYAVRAMLRRINSIIGYETRGGLTGVKPSKAKRLRLPSAGIDRALDVAVSNGFARWQAEQTDAAYLYEIAPRVLRSRDWEIVRLHACEGVMQTTIAEDLGISKERVRQLYDRAIARLAAFLEKQSS